MHAILHHCFVAVRRVCFLLALFAPRILLAEDLPEVRLTPKWPAGTNLANRNYGSAVAMTDKWIAVASQAYSSPPNAQTGAVHVFTAATGTWARMILPPAGALATDLFGQAVAISGDLCLVGMSERSGGGVVHVYNLATGALVRSLTASDQAANWGFGRAIAAHSGRALIGAHGANAAAGKAYVFDIATGMELRSFSAPTSVAGEFFGWSVALDGNVALIGASNRSAGLGGADAFDVRDGFHLGGIVPAGAVAGDRAGVSVALSQGTAILGAPYRSSRRGAAFTHNLRTGQQQMLLASNGVADDFFGVSVATSGNLLAVGAYDTPGGFLRGSVYLFDLLTFSELREVTLRATFVPRFGNAIAMWGNAMAVGGPTATDGVSQSAGVAYIYRDLGQSMPVGIVTAKGDSTPDIFADATFNTFGDVFINSLGNAAFRAVLKGAASHGNTDNGIWRIHPTSGFLTRSNSSYQVRPAGTILSVGTPVSNQLTTLVYPVTYKTGVGGITTQNNLAIFADDGTTNQQVLQSGSTATPFGSAKIQSFGELVQTADGANNRIAVFSNLRKEAATSTTAVNDTGVLVQTLGGASDGRRENDAYPPDNTANIGQLTGRIAFIDEELLYSTALSAAPTTTNAAIVRKPFGVDEIQIARKGDAAPFTSGTFSAFLGETIDQNETVLYRATITGGGSTAADNEGLWSRDSGNTNRLLLRKGQSAALPAKLAKIVSFWAVGTGAGQALVVVQLANPDASGKPVTAANDMALILVDNLFGPIVLMREGQPAQGCHPATIGTISRVEVDPTGGSYAVLCTLAGTPADANQALYLGQCTTGVLPDKATFRAPELFLRKGTLCFNQPSKIKSISLPLGNLTASGAGGTGRGQAVAGPGLIAVNIEFANGVRQIMANAP